MDLTKYVLEDSVSITDIVDDTPTRAAFTTKGFIPTVGQEVLIRLGSDRVFGGFIQRIDQSYVDTPANYQCHVSAIDYTVLLNQRKVSTRYRSLSASSIVHYLIANYAPGFTVANVQLGLEVIDEITFTFEDLGTCLTRLAKRIGGYWYCDYFKDIHFFLAEVTNNPTDLTTSHASLTEFTVSRDIGQVVTRVYVEGMGAPATVAAVVGQTSLVVADTTPFPSSGLVVSGPQRIRYSGKGSGFSSEVSAWHAQAGGNTAQLWTSVAWSPALGLFVAVAGNAGVSAVMSSPDGILWTTRTPAVNSIWQAIAWAPSLALFAAVSSNGLVMTSPDGITWTQRTAAEDSTWRGLVWAPELGLFVAVAIGVGTGTHQVMTSSDGMVWTARNAASTNQWANVCWSPTLGLFAAISLNNAATAIMTSPDGVNWTIRTAPSVGFNIAWSPTLALFVYTASTNTVSSTDGITWTNHAGVAPSGNWRGLVWADFGMFVAISDGSTLNIMASQDGIAWTSYTGPTVSIWRALVWSPQLAKIVGVGSTSLSVSSIMTNAASIYATLTGIPASGDGAIKYAINAGDEVNLLAQVDDAAAQSTLAAYLSSVLGVNSDGIQEDYIQDRRISYTEAVARGEAHLALRGAVEVGIQYKCRDPLSASGKTITVNLPAPTSVTDTFKIQQVGISNFHPTPALYPDYVVQSSPTRFSFEDLLRLTRKGFIDAP